MLKRIKHNLKISTLSRPAAAYEDGSDTNLQLSSGSISHKYPQDFMNIPEELIVRILLFYTTRPPSEHLPVLRQTCFVCKRWKNIIYDNPLFWDTIYINNPPMFDPTGQLNRTRAWIARSADTPMRVYLSLERWKSLGPLYPILEVLGSILPRLHVLIIDGWGESATELRLSGWFHSEWGFVEAKALQKIYISMSTNDSPSETPIWRCGDLQKLIMASPNLKSFASAGVEPKYPEILHYNLPYHQLTQIKIECPMSPEQALRILDDCSALTEYVHFTLDSSEMEYSKYSAPLIPKPHAQNHRVECRAKTISLSTIDSLDYSFFLRLVTPMLEHLELDLINSPHPFRLSSAIKYLLEDNWRVSIRTLTIRNLPIDSRDLIDVLQHVSPTLQSLALCSDRPNAASAKFDHIENFTTEVIQALSYKVNPLVVDVLCPHLENLVLDKVTKCNSRSVDGHLSAMINSRWRSPLPPEPNGIIRQDEEIEQWFTDVGVTRLRSLDIVFVAPRSGTKKDAKRLEEMFKEGLKGGIKYGKETSLTTRDRDMWWG